MSNKSSAIVLLTPVPSQHLESGLAKSRETGLVVFGTDATMVLAEFAASVDDSSPADIFFYASEGSAAGRPAVTFRGKFSGFRGARAGRADKEWNQYRPDSTAADGRWGGFYAVSQLRRLDQSIAISQFSKLESGRNLSRTFVPRGPTIVSAPELNMATVLSIALFQAALSEAETMTLAELRKASGAGKSRSYFVRNGTYLYPLKAIARLAYLRGGLVWDKPQSAALARQFRNDFEIEHITESAEQVRLERQRETIERMARPNQVKFRKELLDLYGGSCAITGCSALDAIDAAHIICVGDDGDDNVANGIILRADLHRLFDRNLMAIDPASMEVRFASSCRAHYSDIDSTKVELPDRGPQPEQFEERWTNFEGNS
ncbi:HNH endonuclease [Pacificimonas sp. WHA3]|uniref:HNH endonuclease n=1 Tax=Pacificimonas pallii TaxID=2827236 RepID=A0ABS6SCG8_9SPHN|nr:HNH endonuclease [Pacificimonas pallii]MBV7256117.1 HNH endonuclease [Pacificimonas pallii]